jgi:hypothetical protein
MRRLLALGILVALAGCYHTVSTTATPSTIVYESSGAYGFLFGLVRPSGTQLAGRCGYGAFDEQRSMNGTQALGALFTDGLWTPMTTRVVCASGPVAIGMSAAEVIGARGAPRSINRTSTAAGTSEQWVYDVGTYVYLDNGKVTAVQDSRRP